MVVRHIERFAVGESTEPVSPRRIERHRRGSQIGQAQIVRERVHKKRAAGLDLCVMHLVLKAFLEGRERAADGPSEQRAKTTSHPALRSLY